MYAYRQQALDNLATYPQAHSAHSKGNLDDLSPTSLQDPVESDSNKEESEEVQHFIALLVGRERVVCWAEASES